MKNKKCPNCLCDINLDAIVCPFCKTQIKSQMKFLPTLGFKPPEVVAQDVKPLHNTKINIDDIELPQFLKKSESDFTESENDNIENNYLEVEEKTEQIPYTPKILNIKDLPQNDNLFIEPEEENVEIVKPSSEFDFNGDLMQEIKAYFEMPSPNSQDYEQKHFDIIENMSIDDIIKGSLDTHKKEHQQESFGLMFGQEEKQEDLPSYQEISKNTLDSSEKVKEIYDKISEQRDYNSYMYDTLDTSLDALGFVDEKVDFGDLKKKLDEPEPSIHNIVEHIPFKIPKLPLKKELNEIHHQEVINNEFTQNENLSFNHFSQETNEINNLKEFQEIQTPKFINEFKEDKINEEVIETPSFINNLKNIDEELEEIDVPSFINSFDSDIKELNEEFVDRENNNINTDSFINKIFEVQEEKQIVDSEKVDKLFDSLQIRGKTLSQEIDKTDPYHREPFEIDNLEIVEVKDYFKEEVEEEIVKASEINVDIDSLKELIDFAGVQEEPENEKNELNSQITDSEVMEKNIPKFQSKNVLRVSDEKIEEKKGEMTPTRIVRDAISELENLKHEFASEEKNEFKEEENIEPKVEINTDLSTWFNNEDINTEIEQKNEQEVQEEIQEDNENQSSVFDLSALNEIQLEFDKSKNSQEEIQVLEPLEIKEDNEDEIVIPSFINQSLEILEPISIENTEELNIEIPENILKIDFIDASNELSEIDEFNKEEVLEPIKEDLIPEIEEIKIPENILNISNDIRLEPKEFIEEPFFKENLITNNINEKIEEDIQDEIQVPEFLNNISIDLEESTNIINEDIKSIEELKVPEPPKFVSPPPPPPPVEEVKLRVPPPPPTEVNNISVPPPSSTIETNVGFSTPPTFDTSLANNPPKIRNPITTTLNTTLGARSTTNQEAMDLYIYARDLCLKKEYGQALDILEKSVRIDPAFEQAHILLSRTYLKLKNVY